MCAFGFPYTRLLYLIDYLFFFRINCHKRSRFKIFFIDNLYPIIIKLIHDLCLNLSYFQWGGNSSYCLGISVHR